MLSAKNPLGLPIELTPAPLSSSHNPNVCRQLRLSKVPFKRRAIRGHLGTLKCRQLQQPRNVQLSPRTLEKVLVLVLSKPCNAIANVPLSNPFTLREPDRLTQASLTHVESVHTAVPNCLKVLLGTRIPTDILRAATFLLLPRL